MAASSDRTRQVPGLEVSETSDQRPAERDAQERFRCLFASNVVGMLLTDVNGNITEANDYFLKIVGYGRADLPLRWDAITPAEWHDRTAAEALAATGGSPAWQMQFIRRDGSRVPVSVGVELLQRDHDTRIYSVHDLTAIWQAQCAACENDKRFGSLLEAGPSVMVCLSPDHRIVEFNRAAERLYGQPRAAVLGQDYLELFVPEVHRKAVASDIQRVLDGHPTRGFENSIRTSDGDERVLVWNVNRILDAAGQPSGVIAVGQDITERKRDEHALVAQQRQLRKMASELALAEQRERRRVAAGLHDQVGQALAMAKLKVDTALGSDLPAHARTSLEQSQELLNESIQATRSLTFQLGSAVLQELGLEAALEQLVEWFEADHDATQFVFATDSEPKPVGEDQALMLYDIARELLFNATKYAQARTVRLRVERAADRIRITIADDGVGFDTASLGDGYTVEGGFGYFSIRERLAYLGGDLQIESSIGHGTRVVTATPLHPDNSNPVS